MVRAPAVTLLVLTSCAFGTGDPATVDPANLPDVVTWDDHTQAILDDHCASCHGDHVRLEGLDYTRLTDAICEWDDTIEAIREGSMPPGGAPEPDAWETAVLARWARDGFAVRLEGQEPVFEDVLCTGDDR